MPDTEQPPLHRASRLLRAGLALALAACAAPATPPPPSPPPAPRPSAATAQAPCPPDIAITKSTGNSGDVACGDDWISLALEGPATDDGCRKTHACEDCGYCYAHCGTCRARTTADCQHSDRCASDGLCQLAREGRCEATAEGCKASQVCDSWGRCLARGGACVATAESCKKTVFCGADGHCSEENGRCVATARDCLESLACSDEGRCTEEGGDCVKK